MRGEGGGDRIFGGRGNDGLFGGDGDYRLFDPLGKRSGLFNRLDVGDGDVSSAPATSAR